MRASWIAFSSFTFAALVSAQNPEAAPAANRDLTARTNGGKVVWKQGTVTLHENGSATVLGDAQAVHRPPGAFRVVLGTDALAEVHYEDGSRLELRSTCDVSVTKANGQKITLRFASLAGMAIHSANLAFHVTLPSAYAFRAHQCFVETRQAEDGSFVVSNYSGTPLLIYEDGRAVDTLAAGLRGFLRPNTTVRTGRARNDAAETGPLVRTDERREWAYRELILPAGIDALPSAEALELVATDELQHAGLVRYGALYFLMGPASKVTISRGGRVIGATGAVSLIRSRSDWSQVFGVASPFSPFAGGAGGSLLRSDVSDAAAGSPGSGN